MAKSLYPFWPAAIVSSVPSESSGFGVADSGLATNVSSLGAGEKSSRGIKSGYNQARIIHKCKKALKYGLEAKLIGGSETVLDFLQEDFLGQAESRVSLAETDALFRHWNVGGTSLTFNSCSANSQSTRGEYDVSAVDEIVAILNARSLLLFGDVRRQLWCVCHAGYDEGCPRLARQSQDAAKAS